MALVGQHRELCNNGHLRWAPTVAGIGCNSLESLNEFGNHHSHFPKRPPKATCMSLKVVVPMFIVREVSEGEGAEDERSLQEGLLAV